MSIALKWDITYRCNLNCNHCLNGDYLNKNIKQEPSTVDLKKVIDRFDDIPVEYVHVLGGEPTARPDFYQIVEYMLKKEISVGFNTNGLKLNYDKLFRLLHDKNFRNIVFSLEGPTAEINDSIRGKDVFDRSVENLKKIILYKEENNLDHLILTLNTVLSKANYEYISDMVHFAANIGVDEIGILQMVSQGNAVEDNLGLNHEEEVKSIKIVAELYQEFQDKLKIVPKYLPPIAQDYCKSKYGLVLPSLSHGCGGGTTFGFLNNMGQLFPCDRVLDHFSDKSKLSLIDNDFYTVWSDERFNKLYEVTEGSQFYQKFIPCNECKYLQESCYPCPVFGFEKSEVVTRCKKYYDELQLLGGA